MVNFVTVDDPPGLPVRFFLILKVLLFCFYTIKLLRFCQLCPTPWPVNFTGQRSAFLRFRDLSNALLPRGTCRRLMFENVFVLPHLFLCCFVRRFDNRPQFVLRFPAYSEWALLETAPLPDWCASVMPFVMIAYCDRPAHPDESIAVEVPCRL